MGNDFRIAEQLFEVIITILNRFQLIKHGGFLKNPEGSGERKKKVNAFTGGWLLPAQRQASPWHICA
jgi:hypothetical protein